MGAQLAYDCSIRHDNDCELGTIIEDLCPDDRGQVHRIVITHFCPHSTEYKHSCLYNMLLNEIELTSPLVDPDLDS